MKHASIYYEAEKSIPDMLLILLLVISKHKTITCISKLNERPLLTTFFKSNAPVESNRTCLVVLRVLWILKLLVAVADRSGKDCVEVIERAT